MTWKLAVGALAIGILGMALALAGWHLWIDHGNHHQLVLAYLRLRAQVAQLLAAAQVP